MQTIKDPSLEPYYIGRDSHCYTVYEVITPDSDRLRTESSKGENYEKPVAHYAKFGSALNKIAECQLHSSKEKLNKTKKCTALLLCLIWVKIKMNMVMLYQ